MTVGLGRSTVGKQYDGFIKWKILNQTKGKKTIPLSITYSGGTSFASENYFDSYKDRTENKFYFYNQLIFCRKFNDYFTLQLAPTWTHYNLTLVPQNPNDLFSVGLGTRIRVSKRVNLLAEYFQQLNNKLSNQPLNGIPKVYNSLSLGCDIETGGHVFQINITNSIGMTEKSFINETFDNFFGGQIHLGFNISRVFVVKKPKEFL